MPIPRSTRPCWHRLRNLMAWLNYRRSTGARHRAARKCTIRAILRDTTSFLPWAKQNYACGIFNVRTPLDETGLKKPSTPSLPMESLAIAPVASAALLDVGRLRSQGRVPACRQIRCPLRPVLISSPVQLHNDPCLHPNDKRGVPAYAALWDGGLRSPS